MSSGATHEYIESIKRDIMKTITISEEDRLILISYLNELKQVHSRELRGFRDRITSELLQQLEPRAYRSVLHSSRVQR
jgi:hypothetical protein